MRKLYTESANNSSNIDNPANIKQRLQEFKPFVYDLSEYVLIKLINVFSCSMRCKCCKTKSYEARKERYEKYLKAKERMSEEFDFLFIIKRIRILSMLTNALFAQRQSIFVSYADKFHISLEEEIQKEGKPPDVLTPEELAEILIEFNPIQNIEDRKLVNYLGGRRIPENELFNLFAKAQFYELPDETLLRGLSIRTAIDSTFFLISPNIAC